MKNIYKTNAMKKFNQDIENPGEPHHFIPYAHMLVCGQTGCGKTNFVVNVLETMEDTFQRIIIAVKDTNEPIYQMLKFKLGDACDLYTLNELPTLKKLQKADDEQILLVVDDFVCEKTDLFKKIEGYSIAGRKRKIMCIFLVHSYFLKQLALIRTQVRMLVLLSNPNKRNFDMTINQMSCDADVNVIKRVISNATKFKLNVAMIDLLQTDMNKKIRRNIFDWYELVDEDGKFIANPTLYERDGIIN